MTSDSSQYHSQKLVREIPFYILLSGVMLVAGCDDSTKTDTGNNVSAVSKNYDKSTADNEAPSSDTPKVSVELSTIKWPDTIEPTYVNMALKKISQHTYFVEGPPGTPTDNDGFMSNSGVVVTDDGVVIFDALGTPSLAFKLFSLVKTVTDMPVKKVVVSHYHADHIYGLQVFKDMGAEIIAPLGAKDYLVSDAAQGRLKERRESLFPWVDENTRLIPPDVLIEKDKSFSLGGIDFEIIALGSTHSQGDIMLRVVPDGVLFSGDLIFEGRIPFIAGSNPDVWLERLTALDTEHIKYVVPGHGGMSTKPKQALQFTKGYLAFLRDAMREAVENLMTFEEVYAEMDWTGYEKLPASQANRVNAYYVYLREEALSMQ